VTRIRLKKTNKLQLNLLLQKHQEHKHEKGKEPLSSLGINKSEFSEFIRSHSFLHAIYHHRRVRLKRRRRGPVHGVAVPVVPHPPLAAVLPSAAPLLAAAEPVPVKEIGAHRQTPQVSPGGRPRRPRPSAGLVGVYRYRHRAGGPRRRQRKRRGERGDVEVGGVEEEQVVEVRGEAERRVGVGAAVVGPTLRHAVEVQRRRRFSDELRVHRSLNKNPIFLSLLVLFSLIVLCCSWCWSW